MEGTNNNSGKDRYNCECEYCLSLVAQNKNKSIDELILDMEKRMGLMTTGLMEIKEKQEAEFTAEGEDITDKLPTLEEALKLKEENEKLKEKIYSLNQQINELKLQIPDKQTKRLSPIDKTLLKEVMEGWEWQEWEAHRALLMRLLK